MLCPDYDSILTNPSLPSLPTVALEVLDLASREDVDLGDFERTIERDQAMSVRILRAVNSSYYGLGRRCGSIRQAVSYLGIQTVKVVLSFSLERAMDFGEDEITFDFNSYWRQTSSPPVRHAHSPDHVHGSMWRRRSWQVSFTTSDDGSLAGSW